MKQINLLVFALLFSFSCFAVVDPITGLNRVCIGQTISLSDLTPGGTWSSSNTAIGTVSTTGVVTGISAGTADIYYTVGTDAAMMAITVNPLPAVHNVIGGGNFCAGGTGAHIGLDICDLGVDYQLFNSSTPVGAPMAGVGFALDFGVYATPGSYTVVGTNVSTGCTRTMTGTANVAVNTLPTAYTVSGGGSYCAGGTGMHVTLSGSDAGTSYQLMLNGIMTGTSLAGTGFTLDFGLQTAPGIYTVTGTDMVTGCSNNMTGSANVIISALATISGPSAVCPGASITLTAGGGSAWTSSTPSVATVNTAGVVSGLVVGTATISYTDVTTGCIGTRTVTVSPSPGAIAGFSTVCVGATTTLANPVPGGVWSTGSSIITIGSLSGDVTGVSTGTATINYSLGTGCTVTKAMTVMPLPAPIMGATSACTGMTITLTDATPGGTWSSAGPAVATISPTGGIIVGISAGSTNIAYTLPTGCARTVVVTINPSPGVISGPSTVCTGNTITLTVSVPGGTMSSSNPSVALVGMSGITGVAPGTADITYAIGSGCAATRTITVTPATCSGTPTGGIANVSLPVICYGNYDTITLVGASSGCGISYQWQTSADGTTYYDVTGLTSTSFTYNATSNMYYRCKTTCATTGLFAYSAPGSITVSTTFAGHSVTSSIDTVCNNLDFYVSTCGSSTSYNVTTWFGDGTNVNTPFSFSGVYGAHTYHAYNLPGTYNIMQVLYVGSVPQDTISYSYEYLYCRTLPIKFYFDANSNCTFDAGDKSLLLPVQTRVDSNGTAIDTISATSGFYYRAYGPVGTIYRFTPISTPAGIRTTCPSAGFIQDTIYATVNNYRLKYFGLQCTAGSSFDLTQHISTQTGRHSQRGTIIVNNTFCTPIGADVTLHFDSRYRYYPYMTNPAAASYTDSTATWHLSAVSTGTATYPQINYWLEVPGSYSSWLLPGTKVISNYVTIAASSGDIDTSNNIFTKQDTVVSSFDPNDIAVSPTGHVLPCTKLHYTIRFENDGNDTADNIYILDTLSNNLDPRSLEVEIATAAMNVGIIKDGPYTIAKFDLPNIKLLDSTHHGQCMGMIIYNIKTKPGLVDGTVVQNRAGIYFDDNPVVLTNTVQNVIGIAPITGPANLCPTITSVLSNPATGGSWSSSNPTVAAIGSATGAVNALIPGTTTVTYSVSNVCGSRSTTTVVTVNPNPTVSGSSVVCLGLTSTLTSTGSGTWVSNNPAVAGVGSTTGIVTGIALDTTTITFTLPTGCKATKTITVTSTPSAITGTGAICSGATTTMSDTTPLGSWYSSTPSVAAIGSSTGIVSGGMAGTATITYSLGASCMATKTITINALPLTYSITGGGAYCSGDPGSHIGLSNSDVGVNYFIYYGSTPAGPFAGTGSSLDFGYYALTGTYTVSATNTTTTCQKNMPDSTTVSATPSVIPSVSMLTLPATSICEGTPVNFTPTAINGGAIPTYQWVVNGLPVATSSTYSFYPANGDVVKVRLTSSATCARPDTASTSVSMTVNKTGPLGVTITASPGLYVAVGETVTFTASVSGSSTTISYQWFINGTSLPGATNATYTTSILFDGDVVKCKVDDNGPCITGGASSVTISLNTVGIPIIKTNSNMNVYPNPNKGSFTIKGSLPGISNEDATIQVTDVLGRVVHQQTLTVVNGNINAQISMATGIASGVYVLSLQSGTTKTITHFIVEQ